MNALYLADADSTNGTMLNGKKLPPRELLRVNSGDHVRFGSIECVACDPSDFWRALRRASSRPRTRLARAPRDARERRPRDRAPTARTMSRACMCGRLSAARCSVVMLRAARCACRPSTRSEQPARERAPSAAMRGAAPSAAARRPSCVRRRAQRAARPRPDLEPGLVPGSERRSERRRSAVRRGARHPRRLERKRDRARGDRVRARVRSLARRLPEYAGVLVRLRLEAEDGAVLATRRCSSSYPRVRCPAWTTPAGRRSRSACARR